MSRISPIFATLFCGLILIWAYEYLFILARHNVNGIDWVLQGNFACFYGNLRVGPDPRWIYSGSGHYAWVAVWQRCRIENLAVESAFESGGENKKILLFTLLVMAFGYGYSLTQLPLKQLCIFMITCKVAGGCISTKDLKLFFFCFFFFLKATLIVPMSEHLPDTHCFPCRLRKTIAKYKFIEQASYKLWS